MLEMFGNIDRVGIVRVVRNVGNEEAVGTVGNVRIVGGVRNVGNEQAVGDPTSNAFGYRRLLSKLTPVISSGFCIPISSRIVGATSDNTPTFVSSC